MKGIPVELHESKKVLLGGTPVDLMEATSVMALIGNYAVGDYGRSLAIASVNLDHLSHFGAGGRWEGTLHANPGSTVDWLYLLDGAPLVSQSQRITGKRWPRLAGSDLADPVLDLAEKRGFTVGFLGGSETSQRMLAQKLAVERPDLRVTGMWSPDRETVSSPKASEHLARIIAESGTQILFVGLGKPRQELWIDEFGTQCRAKVLLAFGAAVDFLAGRVSRAPQWVSSNSLEWLYRLALEPKRLARRYIVDGPASYVKLRTTSSSIPLILEDTRQPKVPLPLTPGSFAAPSGSVDVAVIVVTYNNIVHISSLLDSLRAETDDVTIRVLLADNSSADGTLDFVRRTYPDVLAFATGGNVGYSAAINAALKLTGSSATVVVLNPDLTVGKGSLGLMKRRLITSDAGAVVPRLQNATGGTVFSIHREPSITRALGDAILGQRFPSRPGWAAGTDFDHESYAHAHTVQWATGAALMVRKTLADKIQWDESFFLYSEETDYFRQIRMLDKTIWYEPKAVMTHVGGGSGSSSGLGALLSVNRVRYIRKYHTAAYAALFRAAVALSEALRCWKPNQRESFFCLIREKRWSKLPGPTLVKPTPFPSGAIIIPAHNEENVIGRALEPLARLGTSGQVDVLVICNGCSDETAKIARSFQGVQVLEIDKASKAAALNLGDAATSKWPRIYMDADVQVSCAAVRDVLSSLASHRTLAARPTVHYDLVGANPLIRSYYSTRLRLPSVTRGLWAGGIYALSQQGHDRFDKFPDLTADDLFIDRLFTAEEKKVVEGEPVIFRPPRTLKDQLLVLNRVNRGNREQNGSYGQHSTARATLAEVVRSVRGPLSAVHALIYVGIALAGRNKGVQSQEWERDNSSRRPTQKKPKTVEH